MAGLDWILISFETQDARADLTWRDASHGNVTWSESTWSVDDESGPLHDQTTESVPQGVSGGTMRLHPNGPHGTLLIMADGLSLVLQEGQVSLLGTDGACTSSQMTSAEFAEFSSNQRCFPDQQVSGKFEFSGLRIAGSVVRLAEWHGMETECPAEADCLPGGRRVGERTDIVGMGSISRRTHTYEHLESTAISLDVQAGKGHAYFGSRQLDLGVSGTIRLPLATLAEACESCAALDDESLLGEGQFDFKDLTYLADGRIGGSLSGTAIRLRVDEAPLAPQALGLATGVVGVAAVGATLLFAKIVGGLFFTRLSKDKALEHPRRKAIFDYIHDHPGANFREVARATGIAAGTVRHHLNVLERSELVVEHTHGSTVRLFENHPRFREGWSDLVLLREPALGDLHAWLKANPGSPQKAVLEGMAAVGWSRSTTQHRLTRLVEGGLATIRLQGRLKIYTAADQGPRPAARVPAPGLGPALPGRLPPSA